MSKSKVYAQPDYLKWRSPAEIHEENRNRKRSAKIVGLGERMDREAAWTLVIQGSRMLRYG